MEEIKLPKRSDLIYKEIEEFEDYEFTNCIAYEMAIRNKEVQKVIIDFDKCISIDSNEYFELVNKLENFFIPLGEDYINIEENEEITFKVLGGLYLEYPFINNELREKHNYNQDGMRAIIYDKIFQIRTLKSPFYINQSSKNNNKCSEILKRPTLSIPDKMNKNINISTNLNLPKDELIAYISKIKDEFDKDTTLIKTPLEILGEDFQKCNNKKINKKLIADKFFIYDYITARQEQIKQMNNQIIEEYEDKIQNIKNDSEDNKTSRINNLKKELSQDRINTTDTQILEELKEIENIPYGTARRYYDNIRPYIDNCKYKELITGTIN